MLRARWRHDNTESSVLLVGGRPFGEVSTRRGKAGFRASLLLPTGLQDRNFTQRDAAMQFVVDGVEDYVLQQLTPAARTVLLRMSADPVAPTSPTQSTTAGSQLLWDTRSLST
jgi:hypothetical protein